MSEQDAIQAIAEALAHPPSGTGMTMAEWDHARAVAILEAAAPHIRAAERERLLHRLIDGDPSPIETTFRQFVDDDEAADCALAVVDLIRKEDPDGAQ